MKVDGQRRDHAAQPLRPQLVKRHPGFRQHVPARVVEERRVVADVHVAIRVAMQRHHDAAGELVPHHRSSLSPSTRRSAPGFRRSPDTTLAAATPRLISSMIQPSRRSCSTASVDHLFDQRGWNHDRAILIGDDHVVWKHRDAAAADRLLPVDERQSRNRRRRGDAGGPHRQPGRQYSGDIAHGAIADERGDTALRHARAENVAPEARIRDAVRIDDRDAAGRHVFDRRARRLRRAPRCRRSEILARRNEADRERAADDAMGAGREREGAADPDVAQALLQQDGGHGRRRHGRQYLDRFVRRIHGPRL